MPPLSDLILCSKNKAPLCDVDASFLLEKQRSDWLKKGATMGIHIQPNLSRSFIIVTPMVMTFARTMIQTILLVLTTLLTPGSSLSTNSVKDFWNSPLLVQNLPDPPSPQRLQLIQSKPYRGGFEPTWDINKYEPRIVQGRIPQDLVGSLACNGPGRIRIGDHQYGHWFDGDGYVTLLSLDGQHNKASFQGKYVRTQRFLQQEALMKRLDSEAKKNPPLAFAGAWTQKGQGRWFENILPAVTNPANTAILWLPPNHETNKNPRLFALCEGGLPIEMDPIILATIGDEDSFFSNNKKPDSFFSAHFSRCLETGNIYNHGYKLKPGPGPKEINLMKLDRHGHLLHQASTVMPFDTFVHDSCLSQHHLVYILAPWKIPSASVLKFLLGQSAFGDLYEWDDQDLPVVHIHSQQDLSLKWSIQLPHLMSLYHLVDAHEEKDNDSDIVFKLRIAELESTDRPALERQVADQYRVHDKRLLTILKEYTFLLKQGGDASLLQVKDVAKEAALCEFPIVNYAFEPTAKERRYCWTNAVSRPGLDWLDGIQKVDMEAGTASQVVTFGKGCYCGAPAFVPKDGAKSEDDGYVIATVYKSTEHRNDMVILDASTLKTLCRMELKNHIPYQFHGEFQPGFVV